LLGSVVGGGVEADMEEPTLGTPMMGARNFFPKPRQRFPARGTPQKRAVQAALIFASLSKRPENRPDQNDWGI
jgi:hypothetical protein